MMWRGAIISSVLHGALLIGLVGSLPILPSIFDRSQETDPTELQIPVELVSADALKQFADVPGLRNTAPDTESAVPPPRRAIGLLTPPPAVARERQAPEGQNPEQQNPGEQNQAPPAPSARQRTASISVIVAPAPTETESTRPLAAPVSEAGTVADSTDTVSPERAEKTLPGPVENELLRAVSGRKRNLIVDVLNGDARLRRALTQQSDAAEMPEQARTRTLARLNKAAQAGFPHAQYNLAGKYLRGETVPRDMATAQKWLTRAAEQGYAPAQSLLALMRLTGKGGGKDERQTGEPDEAEAAFWWSLAAEAGNRGAKLATERLQPLLKPQEHIRAQRLRTRWGSLITDLADLATGETSRRDLDRALQAAAEKGDLDAVQSLLARGADADESGDAGRNAVINAAWRGRQRIIQLLLERGVTTESPDDDGRTPLLWAAINGHDAIVTDLVAGGANPNKRDRDGGTALIRAAWNGHISVVSQLIAASADVNARDGNGLTALDHARRERHTAVIRLLEAAGAR